MFGGAPTTTPSTSASPFGAGTSGFGTAPSTFGATAPATFNPPAFGATTSAAPATGSMFAATPAPFGAAATTAATKASFQFGATAPAATSGMFAFGGAQVLTSFSSKRLVFSPSFPPLLLSVKIINRCCIRQAEFDTFAVALSRPFQVADVS